MLALPRSGTAWASVWLDALHDPWRHMRPESFPAGRRACCTGTWAYPKLLAGLDCPIVVLDRASSRGFVSEPAWERFQALPYPRFPWTDLWANPEPIWSLVRPGEALDWDRHAELARLNIQVTDWRSDSAIIESMREYL